MKIICIGRNYADHARELNNPVPDEPVIFLKPDTALLKPGQEFYLPAFTEDLHYECELVFRISKPGKFIDRKFAHKYYDAVTVGIDFTARDLQSKLKEKGLPWEKAKAFDNSAPTGEFISIEEVRNSPGIRFSLRKNGNVVQEGDSSMMLNPVDEVIAHVSRYFTLKQGDLIFTGTPKGVGKTEQGDLFEGFIGERKLLTIQVK